MSTENDPALKALRETYRELRKRWSRDEDEWLARKLLTLQDAILGRHIQLVRADHESAKAEAAKAKEALTSARQAVGEAHRALMAADGPIDGLLTALHTAEDKLRDAEARHRAAAIGEERALVAFLEAVVARHGEDAVEAVVGLPIRTSVSPSAGAELRDALFGDMQ